MRPIRTFSIFALGLIAAAGLADDTAVTIYSTAQPGAIPADLYRPVPGSGGGGYYNYNRIPGYAVIKQTRELDIEEGVSEVSFQGVAALLDPTTVMFESLSDPDGTTVLEQNYCFDLLSMDKMLERYIDKQIIWNGQEVALLSVSGGGMLIQGDEGTIQFVQSYDGVKFPSIADGLITKPTLIWTVAADEGGEQETRISYETQGMTWWADYNMVFHEGQDANSGTIDLGAWVSILNQSGGTYENADLKLIAGDVNRIPQGGGGGQSPFSGGREMRAMAADQGFEEKSFFEYHLYTLGRPTTIPDRSTKQIELFEQAQGIPVEKKLMYDGTSRYMRYGGRQENQSFGIDSPSKVKVFLAFENKEELGLGMPLPSGRIRVSQIDQGDDSFEFIGEDTIDHTPRNEEVMITLGNAFDVVGERRQVSFQRGNDWITETIEVAIRNQKQQPVKVHIQEHLYRWVNANITEISHEYEQLDARTIHIPVTVEPEGEKKVTYTVRYSW